MDTNQRTALALLAFVLMQNARPAKAATLLEALDLVRPDDPGTLRALALAQVRCGQHDAALETLDRLAMAGGASAAFHLLRAQALQGAGRSADARRAMATFLRLREGAAETSNTE